MATWHDELVQMPTLPTPLLKPPVRTLYRILDVEGQQDLDKVDFLTVNGVRFIRASEDITILGWHFASLMAAAVITSTLVGAFVGAWLFYN